MAEAAAAGKLIGGAASIASLGFQAEGTIMKGEGTQSADYFQAAQAERAAEFGKLQASLTDTTMREKLNTTLGNIDTIRAAGNVDPSSPTTMAIEDWNRTLSDRQRTASVLTTEAQSESDLASAAYLRKTGDFALTQAKVGATAGILGGIAKAFT